MYFTNSDCQEVKVLTPELWGPLGGKCLLQCQTLHLLPVKDWGSGQTCPYQTLKVRPLRCRLQAKIFPMDRYT